MRSFESTNPAAAAVHLLLTVCVTMFCTEPWLLGISLLCGIGFFLMRNGRKHAGFHIAALGMPALFAVLNPLWNQHGTTALFFINQRAYTAEALFYGAVAGLRLAAVLYWFRCFSDLMTSEKLFYLLRGISPKLALIFSMSVRNLTLYRQQLRRIQTAQKAIGLYREAHLIDDVRSGLRVFSILVTWALENGIITANSMAARGYGIGRRSSFAYFRWHISDWLLLAVTLLLTAAAGYGMASGALTWQFYPVCMPPAYTPAYGGTLAAFTALALLPVLHEGKEALTWHCLRQNI